jgi:formylglycine-generating enzyme required for sulfatase activity
MKHIQTWLAVIVFMICAPSFADDANTAPDPFQQVVANYRAANPKPQLPEEARKYKVQAEFAVQGKQFANAADLYGKALEIAPWWPEGHFNRALILGETKKYWDAMREMKRYLLLVPDAPDARAAQDKIYQWEGGAGPDMTKLKEFQDCPECPVMIALPVGSFDMGSNNGGADEKPVHRVTIAKPFAIEKTEVTQAQWKSIMGNNPSHFSGGLLFGRDCENCPVEQVNWNDAQAFIQKLNAKTGKQYRLPSEAEWEYACRAGSQQEYCGSDDVNSVAWNANNSGDRTHPVATKQANAFGLYDMSGNVWEWVEDSYHESYNGAPTDGSVWSGDGAKRVFRGGSWHYLAQRTRAAMRAWDGPEESSGAIGFRLARTLP